MDALENSLFLFWNSLIWHNIWILRFYIGYIWNFSFVIFFLYLIIWIRAPNYNILRLQSILNSSFIFLIIFCKFLLKCTAKIGELFFFPHCYETKSWLNIILLSILNEKLFVFLWLIFTIRAIVKNFSKPLILHIKIIVIKIFLLDLNFLVFAFFLICELTNLWSLVYK
jgi:hypothetical protein